MGLTDWLFGKSKGLNTPSLGSLSFPIPNFSGTYNREMNATFVAICNAHARHMSKIKPKVTLNGDDSASKKRMNYLLSLRPNPLMTSSNLYETIAYDYYMTDAAFIFLEWDFSNPKTPLKAIWPLNSVDNQMSLETMRNGALGMKFTLEGITRVVDVQDLIMLIRNSRIPELLGRGDPAINTILKVTQAHYEGVEQAIKTSAMIRYIVQLASPKTAEVRRQMAKEFSDNFLGANGNGVIFSEAGHTITPVTSVPKYANAEEVDSFRKELFMYLGANEKMLMGQYTEDEWQSYYESILEPLIVKLEDELTYKLLSIDEINRGNRVVIEQDRLHTASLKTRVAIADRLLRMPIVKPNQVAELLFVEKTENGDKEYGNLNWVDANKQDSYQDVPDEEKPKEGEDDAPKPKPKQPA